MDVFPVKAISPDYSWIGCSDALPTSH